MHRFARFLRDCAASASVAVGILLVTEIVLRLLAPQLPRTEPSGSRAIPDSLLGYRYQPNTTVRHITPEFSVTYAIDEHGMRKRDASEPADTSAMRILAIGDSFTFGDGNAEKDTWIRVAERTVRERVQAQRGVRVEVINAGVEGYDTRSELLWLRELVPKVRPQAVVLGFVANDVYTNQSLSAPPPPILKPQRKGAFSLHAVALAKRLAMHNDRLYTRMFMLTARRAYYAAEPDSHVTRQLGVTRELIRAMAQYCAAHDLPLIVVSIPQEFSVISVANDFKIAGIDPAAADRELEPVAHDAGCVWIETLPRLSAVYRDWHRDLFYRVDGHLTAEGNRVLGELVAAALIPRAWSVQPH
jgi:lysophospholipase L1-like esterase